ncbi:MAG: dephospho-CoA kinase [Gammaproteobacteria bacterium]|nr:dephospho-CoA kinase [Gammaproteobacteria bacterium]
MLRIGLTGGIASGKSEAARLFASFNTPIIDADEIAHQLTQAGQTTLTRISQCFGKEYIHSNGTLDRSRLRTLIFADNNKRQQLEAILHPLIHQGMSEQLARLHDPYCILVIPLLFETGFTDLIDRILVIDTPEQNQRQRASQRDKTSTASIQAIIDSQTTRQERISKADDIIYNDANLEHLYQQVEILDNKYRDLARAR